MKNFFSKVLVFFLFFQTFHFHEIFAQTREEEDQGSQRSVWVLPAVVTGLVGTTLGGYVLWVKHQYWSMISDNAAKYTLQAILYSDDFVERLVQARSLFENRSSSQSNKDVVDALKKLHPEFFALLSLPKEQFLEKLIEMILQRDDKFEILEKLFNTNLTLSLNIKADRNLLDTLRLDGSKDLTNRVNHLIYLEALDKDKNKLANHRLRGSIRIHNRDDLSRNRCNLLRFFLKEAIDPNWFLPILFLPEHKVRELVEVFEKFFEENGINAENWHADREELKKRIGQVEFHLFDYLKEDLKQALLEVLNLPKFTGGF